MVVREGAGVCREIVVGVLGFMGGEEGTWMTSSLTLLVVGLILCGRSAKLASGWEKTGCDIGWESGWEFRRDCGCDIVWDARLEIEVGSG